MGMRPKGTPQQLEQRRRKAIALLEQGHTQQQTADLVGASHGTISDWKKAYQKYGEAFFEAHSPPGQSPRLSEKQIARLKKLLLQGARKNGYGTALWTLRRIVEVIEKHFGIAYDQSSVWHILNRMGWSCQKPEKRARERDEEANVGWRQNDWRRLKKSPQNGEDSRFSG
jgi:transposase